jgi:hypothetical protein
MELKNNSKKRIAAIYRNPKTPIDQNNLESKPSQHQQLIL